MAYFRRIAAAIVASSALVAQAGHADVRVINMTLGTYPGTNYGPTVSVNGGPGKGAYGATVVQQNQAIGTVTFTYSCNDPAGRRSYSNKVTALNNKDYNVSCKLS